MPASRSSSACSAFSSSVPPPMAFSSGVAAAFGGALSGVKLPAAPPAPFSKPCSTCSIVVFDGWYGPMIRFTASHRLGALRPSRSSSTVTLGLTALIAGMLTVPITSLTDSSLESWSFVSANAPSIPPSSIGSPPPACPPARATCSCRRVSSSIRRSSVTSRAASALSPFPQPRPCRPSPCRSRWRCKSSSRCSPSRMSPRAGCSVIRRDSSAANFLA
mmetsp:Transcript_25318/g.58880  ORF Transcript_25318/g.58880 Transcript_25318/m.58880 type:complete len:218 (-) Transcript_25318:607-1260(-)